MIRKKQILTCFYKIEVNHDSVMEQSIMEPFLFNKRFLIFLFVVGFTYVRFFFNFVYKFQLLKIQWNIYENHLVLVVVAVRFSDIQNNF